MRYTPIKDLTPGMILGRQIVTEDGIVLLNQGIRLTNSHINILQGWGVPFVYTLGENEEAPSDGSSLFITKASFMKKYVEAVETIKRLFESAEHFNQIPIRKIHQAAQMLHPMVTTIGALDYLYEMSIHSDNTYQHLVNAAVVSGIFGKWLNYQGSDYDDLVLSGLLHDIGKLRVPLSILHKPGKLSANELSVIRKHPEYGYDFIKDSGEIPYAVKMAILQHHERLDGSGYPFGIKNSNIHHYAKIVAVADIYTAITAERAYRPSLTPFTAIEAIMRQMYYELDVSVCLPLLENMRDHFMGSHVLLSNGQKAQVIVLPHNNWEKPTVRTHDGILLDLRKEQLTIVNMLNS